MGLGIPRIPIILGMCHGEEMAFSAQNTPTHPSNFILGTLRTVVGAVRRGLEIFQWDKLAVYQIFDGSQVLPSHRPCVSATSRSVQRAGKKLYGSCVVWFIQVGSLTVLRAWLCLRGQVFHKRGHADQTGHLGQKNPPPPCV